MSEQWIRLHGRDPLIFRDGRPFGSEPGALSARTLALPFPGTLAGVLRTAAGNAAGWQWNGETATQALQVEVAGPLLERDRTLCFPAPLDALLISPEEGAGRPRVHCLRPDVAAAGNTDLPFRLLPLCPPEEGKPAKGYAYWTREELVAWLAHPDGEGFAPPGRLQGPEREHRAHVAIAAEQGTSREGHLFTTEGLSFRSALRTGDEPDADEYEAGQSGAGDGAAAEYRSVEWSLLARVRGAGELPSGLISCGGEGRLALLERLQEGASRERCPGSLAERLAETTRVRLLLATPAHFAGGWRPGWLDEGTLEGTPPGVEGLRLRLTAAAVGRREAVSGWDYQRKGPKAVRWLVPAGSVYFFEVAEGEARAVAERWLEPISDGAQDRRDGYGLALWGVW